MKAPIIAALTSALILTGCGGGGSSAGSGLNPFGWFRSGPKGKTLQKTEQIALPRDSRGLVDQIVVMRVERVPGGAIIRATGLPPTQGYWDGSLKPENEEKPVKGTLVYRFVIAPPPGFEQRSTPQSREVVVARYVTNAKLQGVSRIVVQAARNQMSSRR